MKKNLKTIFSNFETIDYLFLAVLVASLVLRLYKPLSYYYYAHDQDLASWFFLDVVKNGHLRLIGQETSVHGVFIGPLFYYLLIPFYLLFGGQPYGGILLVGLLGLFSVFSIYFVFSEIVNKKAGFIGSILYSFSYIVIFTDREVVPTMPVYLWSIWYLYVIHLVLESKQKQALTLAGLLFGLVWHLNMGLVVVAPLFFLALVLTKQKLILKNVLYFAAALILLMLPFFVFELRHGFIQTQAILAGGTAGAHVSIYSRFDRLLQILGTNARNILWGDMVPLSDLWAHLIILIFFAAAIFKKVIKPKLSVLLVLWLLTYVTFFTLNAINVSEYYLNGMTVVWLLGISATLSLLTLRFRILVYSLLVLFITINLIRFSRYPVNDSGSVLSPQTPKIIITLACLFLL